MASQYGVTGSDGGRPVELDEAALRRVTATVLTRWPCAGVAIGVIREGRPTAYRLHGVADSATRRPVTPDTVFRVGSLTKVVTAVAVMGLWEDGRLDLDAPANDYLRTFQVRTSRPGLRPATVRHLLTHTSGIGYWSRLTDLVRPGPGSGVQADRLLPLAEVYRRGLPQEVQPGTKWAYSNHAFAALGQIVEDVSGQPLGAFYRDRILDPLGMEHTDLARSQRVWPGLATGYVVRRSGLRPAPTKEVPAPGSGGLYSTVADVGRFAGFLLHPEGSGVLRPETVATMFQPHFRPDPRLPGMGLGFDLGRESGVPIVAKGGTVAGFHSQLALAPAEGVGVVVLTNTGGLSGQGASTPLASALLRALLGLPEEDAAEIPPHPESWASLCGWYAPTPGPVTNLFTRILMGTGVEVLVERNTLMLKPMSPIPSMRKGMALRPDDPDDPLVFRVDFLDIGIGTLPVVFALDAGGPTRFFMDLTEFHRRPEAQNPRRLATGALAAGVGALAVRTVRQRAGRE